MAHVKIRVDSMKSFCNEVFTKFGFTKDESAIITDVLMLSDIYGIESHGVQRLVRYHKGIESGMIKIDAKPEIVHGCGNHGPDVSWYPRIKICHKHSAL